MDFSSDMTLLIWPGFVFIPSSAPSKSNTEGHVFRIAMYIQKVLWCCSGKPDFSIPRHETQNCFLPVDEKQLKKLHSRLRTPAAV
jgi:hypothetical protein